VGTQEGAKGGMVPLLSEFGLNEIESGAVAFSLLPIERLYYVLAAAPTDL
jgi:hypothetical protein